jgi:hypothetical protein
MRGELSCRCRVETYLNLGHQYTRALGVLIDVEEGHGSRYYEADVNRARQDLLRLAGPPPERLTRRTQDGLPALLGCDSLL